MRSRVLWSAFAVCVCLPGASRAQPQEVAPAAPPAPTAEPQPLPLPAPDIPTTPASGVPVGPRPMPGGLKGGSYVGPFHNYGFPYGPRVAPPWSYPFLSGGPFVGYAGPPGSGIGIAPDLVPLGPAGPNFAVGVGVGYPYGFGFPFYSGRAGSSWSNGLSLYGPPVPVYGPIPGVFGNYDLVRQWRSTLAPGLAGYGWFGVYSASPRPRFPTVSSWPVVEGVATGPVRPVPAAKVGGCLILSVKVPQPAAEVLVDGRRTTQTGTDRTFESPPLEAGKAYEYTITARWIENGQVVEMSKSVSGTPGEVVRVDFGAPLTVTGK